MGRWLIEIGVPGLVQSNTPSHTAKSNIETVVQLEEEEERHRSFANRFPEMIGRFAGSVTFVICQLAFVGLWTAANSAIIPGLPVFDPFPFSLPSSLLSLEGVLLAAFVLIRQNRMSLIADRRLAHSEGATWSCAPLSGWRRVGSAYPGSVAIWK